jgi:hypothetical protein
VTIHLAEDDDDEEDEDMEEFIISKIIPNSHRFKV